MLHNGISCRRNWRTWFDYVFHLLRAKTYTLGNCCILFLLCYAYFVFVIIIIIVLLLNITFFISKLINYVLSERMVTVIFWFFVCWLRSAFVSVFRIIIYIWWLKLTLIFILTGFLVYILNYNQLFLVTFFLCRRLMIDLLGPRWWTQPHRTRR